MRPFLVPTLLLALAAALGCSEVRNGTGTISKRIGEIVHTPGARQVDLGQLTTFGWDRFYAFKPGTTREEVCRFVGAGTTACNRSIRIARAPDDHMFLVFGLGSRLTHIELHALENGQFDMQFTEAGYPRSKAVFRVRRVLSGPDGDVVLLEPS